MDYYAASREVQIKRLIGFLLMFVGLLLLALGSLKFIYISLDGAGPPLANLDHQLKQLVRTVHDVTKLPDVLWQVAPVPTPQLPPSAQSIAFGLCYVAAFLGASLLRSASRLAKRLRDVDRAIEDELMRESLRSKRPRTREQLKEQAQVPKQSVWKEIHTLYVAPLIVLLIGAILVKLLGLV